MNKLHEIIKIADIHASKIRLAMNEIKDIFPIDEHKVETLNQEKFLFIELLVGRFSKLQDSIGEKIIDAFFEEKDERVDDLTMIDKLNKLERLRIIDDAEIWKKMRRVRNYLTHEYPELPAKTAKYLNVLYTLAPKLLEILENIKKKSNMQ